MEKEEIKSYFNSIAKRRDYWRRRNWYYHKELERFFKFIIPENSSASVIEIGCGTGDLIASLNCKNSVGIDFSEEMIKIAKEKYPHIEFYVDDIENLSLSRKFDFVIMQDLLGHLSDVYLAFRNLRKITTKKTRIIITTYNHLWEPIILFAEKLGLKMKQPYQNWLPLQVIENLLYLNDYEVVKKGFRFLFPIYIPLISNFINRCIAKLPIIKIFCLVCFIIAKQTQRQAEKEEYSCSIVIPCRNEAGNIEEIVKTLTVPAKNVEIIFVDGASTDGTVEKIKEMAEKFKSKNIKLIHQGGPFGKADAVRKGFDAANGDILIVHDADLTVPSEDVVKFYTALAEGKGEFINGTRLVYPLEKGAMRLLNMLGNKIFSILFTWILEQRITDTLCGTKALFKDDYFRIKVGRKFFGDFDPFGDFDLLFGAAKLNLKIVEMPVRYKRRTYGETKISRWKHGWLLLKMCIIGFRKFKLQ